MSETALQDRYLDTLLEMVFEEQEEKDVERLVQSPDPELTQEQNSQAERILEKAFRESEQRVKKETFLGKTQKGNRAVKRFAAILAVLLFLSSVGFAASAEFREVILRMFVRLNERENSVWLYPDEESYNRNTETYSGVPPPGQWRGMYYFSVIPEGFALDAENVAERSVRYTNENRAFTFAEHANASENDKSLTGLDYTEVEEEDALYCGRFTVWENKPVLAWDDVFCWFELIGENMEKDELISIAELLLPLPYSGQTQEDQNPESAAAVPAVWGGDWYPSFLPSGMSVTHFSREGDYNTITLSNGFGRTIFLAETGGLENNHGTLLENTVISTIPMGSGEATLIDGYAGGSNTADVVWREGEKTLRVRSTGYNREDTVQIAESVRRLTDEEKQERVPWSPDDYEVNHVQAPEHWQGDFFPSFLPNGFHETYYSFTNQDMESIRFHTADYEWEIMIQRYGNRPDLTYPGKSSVQIISLGDQDAFMLQSDQGERIFVQMMLQLEDNWYNISSNGVCVEEIMKIAQSMKENEQLMAKDPVNQYHAGFEKAEAPTEWPGHCFPTMLPSDLALDAIDTADGFLAWQGKNGQRMTFLYCPASREVHFGELHVQVTSLTVNGCPAYMMDETLFSVPKVCIFWRDQSGFYELRFTGFPTDEAQAIAGTITGI